MKAEGKGFAHFLKEILATGLFSGYIPVMPGTMGTLVGVLVYILLSPLAAVYYLALILLIIVAVRVSDYAEKHIFRVKDAPHIVIDEIVGFLLAMTSFPFQPTIDSIKYLVIGFVLFRVLDIWKPYPIRQSQKLEGGLGVVMDDLLAGVYTNLFLQFLRIVGALSIR